MSASSRRIVAADVRADCPFSIAQEYATEFLAGAADGVQQADIRVPLRLFGVTLHRRVNVTFSIHTDRTEPGRPHDQLSIRWTSGNRLLPDFHGTIRFRIDGTGTRILIDGDYRTPLGLLGALFDRYAGNRIAETSASDLASRIAAYVERRQRAWRGEHAAAVTAEAG